eukprot:366553-Rhodomonas_salina.1
MSKRSLATSDVRSPESNAFQHHGFTYLISPTDDGCHAVLRKNSYGATRWLLWRYVDVLQVDLRRWVKPLLQ